jgi:hypothetical protein
MLSVWLLEAGMLLSDSSSGRNIKSCVSSVIAEILLPSNIRLFVLLVGDAGVGVIIGGEMNPGCWNFIVDDVILFFADNGDGESNKKSPPSREGVAAADSIP